MNNSELFKKVFGIYAEEFWAYPEEKMLDWLTSNVPDRNVGDMIFRQDAIDATWEKMTYTEQWYVLTEVRKRLKALPSAQSDIVEKLLAAGKQGKESRIYIGGRLFRVRELAQ